eukprot:GHVU01140438.1.p2 GENE.GHVU01140438.1~~GHVU01140438.1.p2  ORF type:complete len:126 (-),score=16.13 GHVU01140438.1:419-796(-)
MSARQTHGPTERPSITPHSFIHSFIRSSVVPPDVPRVVGALLGGMGGSKASPGGIIATSPPAQEESVIGSTRSLACNPVGCRGRMQSEHLRSADDHHRRVRATGTLAGGGGGGRGRGGGEGKMWE